MCCLRTLSRHLELKMMCTFSSATALALGLHRFPVRGAYMPPPSLPRAREGREAVTWSWRPPGGLILRVQPLSVLPVGWGLYTRSNPSIQHGRLFVLFILVTLCRLRGSHPISWSAGEGWNTFFWNSWLGKFLTGPIWTKEALHPFGQPVVCLGASEPLSERFWPLARWLSSSEVPTGNGTEGWTDIYCTWRVTCRLFPIQMGSCHTTGEVEKVYLF